MSKAIEESFPYLELDKLAELESFRKEVHRPMNYIHKWWAKRLGSVFKAIITGALAEGEWPDQKNLFDANSKVVLDPFMGSGTTISEALRLNAKAIGCDINPVSTFSVTQALTYVPEEDLVAEFQAIVDDIGPEIRSYFTTRHDDGSTDYQVLYYFWVSTVETPEGEIVPLFKKYIFSQNAYPSRKPISRVVCPSCWDIFEANYNSTYCQCPNCEGAFNPQNGPVTGAFVVTPSGEKHKIIDLVKASGVKPKQKMYAMLALDSNGKKFYKRVNQYDLDLFDKASADLKKHGASLSLPTMHIREGHNTKQPTNYNYKEWRDLFNERQLLCLGILLKRILEIEDKSIRDLFICLFSGCLEFNNVFCSFKGEGTGAVRHIFSNHILKPELTPLENSVLGVKGKSSGTFISLFYSRLLKAKNYQLHPFDIEVGASGKSQKSYSSRTVIPSIKENISDLLSEKGQAAIVLNGDSGALDLPDNSVDAVITDPPYFDFIHYSELSDFFYSWLHGPLAEEYDYFQGRDSSDKNESQDKDPVQFSLKIGRVFTEVRRVLKPDGLLCFSYHHSTVEGWSSINDALRIAKLKLVAAHPIKAEMSVATPKSGSNSPINLDMILVCKASFSGDIGDEAKSVVEADVRNIIKAYTSIGRKLSLSDLFVISMGKASSESSRRSWSKEEEVKLLAWAKELSVTLFGTLIS